MPAAFSCGCDRRRIERVLISLGKKELGDMIEEGRGAEIGCQFCNTQYQFSVDELKELYRRSE